MQYEDQHLSEESALAFQNGANGRSTNRCVQTWPQALFENTDDAGARPANADEASVKCRAGHLSIEISLHGIHGDQYIILVDFMDRPRIIHGLSTGDYP